ncbi:pyridoxal phosphate-dependent aminotransferase [Phenylobacterium sp.]|uniref:pyridoxal phosphate-dependent aminotransferase n=1 Tax=Phenylobacterium sp. TaxID=1871053 RepID=UPI001226A4AE|nr:pyridoxal phosphate-dependent aminotransferase [Phenylobacterium sp.]THD58864.1 MAG: aminotransferase class I/II-fold pyridoxal phosphate-dependent enzyme [Phenylobacterium sp.]
MSEETQADTVQEALPKVGRRAFLWGAAIATAAPIMSEADMAWAKLASQSMGVLPPDAVIINANENPLGPCKAACEAIGKIGPLGGRYDRMGYLDAFTNEYAAMHGVKPENVAVYAGSSEPLHYTTLAFTSPTKSLVMADPSYESANMAAQISKAPVHKVPLTSTYAHDVKKMVAADPNAGLIYIVNPNNPTGTVTAREDILWALENKPKGSVLLVDEAYIHLSDEQTVMDQVAAGKDIVVLRTFSKIYGMAGIRCGVAVARPDLLAQLMPYYQNAMPVTALAAARASIADKDLIPTRKKWIADSRNETLSWLKANGYKPVGNPVSNCFMIETGRPAKTVISAMQKEKVYIGRVWPVWPNAVRISVGSPEDMAAFRTAFKKVMDAPATTAALDMPSIKGAGGKAFLS